MEKHLSKRLTQGLALLVACGLSACSFIATPPADLLAKNDHVALAAWYDNEAARLRQKAKEMNQMAEEYAKDPERAQRMMSHGSPKVDFVHNVRSSPLHMGVLRGKRRPWPDRIAS